MPKVVTFPDNSYTKQDIIDMLEMNLVDDVKYTSCLAYFKVKGVGPDIFVNDVVDIVEGYGILEYCKDLLNYVGEDE